MMGERKSDPQLFNYAVNLEKRVRANHPLRQVKAAIDLSFVREEVAHCYGKNGNESVAPEVILKMMFLLFFDDIASERELMEVIGERLDYLWFLRVTIGVSQQILTAHDREAEFPPRHFDVSECKLLSCQDLLTDPYSSIPKKM